MLSGQAKRAAISSDPHIDEKFATNNVTPALVSSAISDATTVQQEISIIQ